MANSENTRYSKGFIKNVVKEKRVWQYTDFGKRLTMMKNPSQGLNFTVMSYNILSQSLLEIHRYLYRSCTNEFLKWNYRSRNLLQEIVEHNVDIICLQEIQEDHYEGTFLPYLTKFGYLGVYKRKTGIHCDGCAVLFKKDVFCLETYSGVEYQSPYVKILDRDNVGLVVVLQPVDHKFQEIKLCVATTHLLFNPKRGDVKLAQLRILLAEIERYACKSSSSIERVYHPLILCGDMNSEPYSSLYNFITRGFINFENMISGNVSGQFSGFNKGRLMTEHYLSLTALGINQNSCYESINLRSVPNNTNHLQKASVSDLSKTSDKLHVSANSSQSCGVDYSKSMIPSSKKKSGRFFHSLCFASAYKHYKNDGNREITTFNEDTNCTVDYIFYGIGHGHNGHYSSRQLCVQNIGQLKHVSSYGLLNLTDLKQLCKLPNAYLSSDHICLISRFLLKL